MSTLFEIASKMFLAMERSNMEAFQQEVFLGVPTGIPSVDDQVKFATKIGNLRGLHPDAITRMVQLPSFLETSGNVTGCGACYRSVSFHQTVEVTGNRMGLIEDTAQILTIPFEWSSHVVPTGDTAIETMTCCQLCIKDASWVRFRLRDKAARNARKSAETPADDSENDVVLDSSDDEHPQIDRTLVLKRAGLVDPGPTKRRRRVCFYLD
jgi:hypothetical protein